MGVPFKRDVVTKTLSFIEQHKEDLGAGDYADMMAFLMAQFGKEMPLFRVTYAKLTHIDGVARHVRKTKLVCTADHSSDIVVPTENECMHGIRFVDSEDGRAVLHFEHDAVTTPFKRTLIHAQRLS